MTTTFVLRLPKARVVCEMTVNRSTGAASTYWRPDPSEWKDGTWERVEGDYRRWRDRILKQWPDRVDGAEHDVMTRPPQAEA